MKLLKVFRRYNHILLMVFMSLLLVTFLIPQTVQGCSNRRVQDVPSGMAFGKTIHAADLRQASIDMQTAAALGMARRNFQPLDAYLLIEEARRLGIRVPRAQVKEGLTVAGAAPRLSAIASRQGRSVDSLYDSIGNFIAMNLAAQLQQEPIVSGRASRIEIAYRDQAQEAIVQLSVIPSEAFLAGVDEPTEDEISAQFERGKDRVTAHDDDGFVFGYRYDDRVAIEYLTVDPAKIQKIIRVSGREAREQYDQDPTRYVGQRLVTGPSSQPVAPRFESRQLTFEEALVRVKGDKRELKAAAESQRLMNEIKRAADGPWNSAGLGDDRYLIVPSGAADISFEELRERFSRDYAVEYHKTELLDVDALRQLDGIGRARGTDSRGRDWSLTDLALRVKGLAIIDQDDPVKGLNLLEPSDLIMVQKTVAGQRVPYQAFIFRVIRIAPAAPPTSVEPVRDQVVEDIKTTKAHEIAKGYAEQVLAAAQSQGLAAAVAQSDVKQRLLDAQKAAAEANGGLAPFNKRYADALEPFKPSQRLTRRAFFLDAKLGTPGPIAEKVFELAQRPAPDGGHRVTLVQMVTGKKWVVVELEEVKPLYQNNFDRQRDALMRRSFQIDAMRFEFDWFDSDNIRARTHYVPPPRDDASDSAG